MKTRTITILALGLGLVLTNFGQTRQSEQGRPMPEHVARRFLTTIYPELAGKDYVLTVASRGSLDSHWHALDYFSATVRRFREDQPVWEKKESGELAPLKEGPLLSAFFFCDSGGRITQFLAGGGSIVRQESNEIIAKLVNSHPEWSDNQVIRALKEAGAKFGPEEAQALRKAIPLVALEKFLGKQRLKSVEFSVRLPEDSPSRSLLIWDVVLRPVSREGQEFEYVLGFEPFEGKLRHLTKRKVSKE